MKIVFAKQDPATVLKQIASSIGGPTLKNMISFNLGKNNHLEVTIKKAGTSHLSFSFHESPQEIIWQLTSQKIALAHLAFKATIFERLTNVIERQGGKVIDQH